MSFHPFLQNDSRPKWSQLKEEFVESDIQYELDLLQQRIDKISNLKDEEISFENVFIEFENISKELHFHWGKIKHLVNVRETKELREAHSNILPKVSEFSTTKYLNQKLWNVIKKAAEHSKNENLTSADRRFIDEIVEDFKQSGADLEDDKKERIKQIDIEIAQLSKQFSDNVKDSTNKGLLFITNEEDLKGLPQSVIDAAKEDAIAKDHPNEWLFTLKAPSYTPLLKYADSEDIRKQIYDLSKTIGRGGEYDNTEIAKKLSQLRDEESKIFGYKTFADFITSRRMAQTGDNALKFEIELHDKIFPFYMKENDELKNYMKSKDENAEFAPWNTSYWAEKMRKEIYDFNEEDLKPYFSTEKVLEGLFQIAQTLFNIKVVEKETYVPENGYVNESTDDKIEVWDKDVKFIEVYDLETNKLLAGIYIDLYPRDNKRAGGWMNVLFYGNPEQGIPHVLTLNGNLTKPTSGKPALLTHRNVSTIFHEFGHCLHGLFYKGDHYKLSSMHVPWDFVEVPSQFMSNFTWEKSALDLFAKHYETNETIPKDLYEKMIRAKNYRIASAFMRQLYLGRIDLAMHHEYEKWKDYDDLDKLDEIITHDYHYNHDYPRYTSLRTLKHIYGSSVGYAAGYYSYKWAQVIDNDCFSRFQKEGILNKELGMKFRKEILEKGNTIPVQDEFRNFMGRDPSQEALLVNCGFIDKK